MKVAIGCDHGGYDLKERIVKFLTDKGYEVDDKGCYDKNSCDYPVYGKAVAHAVADGVADKGIVICTTGIGISICANKVKGIRCALCTNELMARMTRLHNDSNVIALGANVVGPGLAEEMVEIFLTTPYSGEEKHTRRINLLED